MSCGSGPLGIKDGKVTTVAANTKCVAIPEEVISFEKGTPSAWVFINTHSVINQIDFSRAIHLQEIGNYTFYNCSKVEKFDLSACTALSYIGMGAFQGCAGATSIILPNSPLTVLPSGCFSYCEKLQSFEVPSNIQIIENDKPDNKGLFSFCSSLQTVTFQKNSQCTTIGSKAFFETGIEILTLPKSLKEIGGWTFRVVSKLKTINVEEGSLYFKSIDGILYTTDDGLQYYPPKATAGTTAKLAPGTKAILEGALIGVNTYTGIEIPNTVKRIDNTAFYDFNSLKTITIPSSVETIGYGIFRQCTGLTNVVFQNNLTEITKEMFRGCRGLKTFDIPSGVEKINDFAFAYCKQLTDVFVPKSVKLFGNAVFSNCPSNLKFRFEEGSDMVLEDNYVYNQQRTDLIFYIGSSTTILIKSSVKNIAGSAFQGKEITEVTFENKNNVKFIGPYAFDKCKELKSIELPSINSIEMCAFQASGLTSIDIPASIKLIKEDAFRGCASLTTVTFSSATVPAPRFLLETALATIGKRAFSECHILSTCVLPESVQYINEAAFYNCKGLTTFKLPNSLQTISKQAFAFSAIESFTYDAAGLTLQTFDSLAFTECNKLQSFIIPNSVTSLKDNCISNCALITKITLGSGIQTISDYAINFCPLLETIEIGPNENLWSIPSLSIQNCETLSKFEIVNNNHFSFVDGCLLDYGKTNLMLFLKASNIKVLVLPETVQNIYMNAFSGCQSLENVTLIGDTLAEIGYHAFANCSSLKYISFPGSLTTIGEGAFKNCNLVSASLVNTKVENLQKEVFANNVNLNLVVIPNTLKKCASNTFEHTGKHPIVFYYGRNVITNEVGLTKTSSVYCLNGYTCDIYLGLPVKTNYEYQCTLANKNRIFNNYFMSLSFIILALN